MVGIKSLFICLFYFIIKENLCYVFNVGDCIVYYDESCGLNEIQFYLYSKSYSRVNVNILDPFKPVLPYNFNFSVPTKILIHGYGGLGVDYAIRNISKAYKELGYNIILVDWSSISAVPCYPAAFLNTWHVGQCTAVLSVSLAKLGLSPNMIHILGFSLGAHIASFASNHLQKTLGIPYYRITGLDPALPLFATLHNEWKLDPSDATFVDVLHTSAGSFGKLEALGHIDFYINGGTMQPACKTHYYPTLCSHMMAGEYFANTIKSKEYYGFDCPSIVHYNLGLCDANNSTKALMGEYVNISNRGIYFVEIPDNPPQIQSTRMKNYYYKSIYKNQFKYNYK